VAGKVGEFATEDHAVFELPESWGFNPPTVFSTP